METEPTHAVSSRTPSTHIHRDSPTSDIELSTLANLSTQHTQGTTTAHDLVVTASNERESEASVTTSLLSNKIKPSPLPTPSNPTSPNLLKKIVLDTWICETFSIVLSMACVCAVAVVVGYYDGESIPQYPSGLTLNTIISILSTAARSALVYVLSATVGQLKWHWFSKTGRHLRDVQVLDDASRGPLGSIFMLLSFMRSFLAILSGVTMVMVIALGPFLQQLVDYPTRTVEAAASEAKIMRNLNYSSLSSLYSRLMIDNNTINLGFMSGAQDPEVNYAIKAGLYSDPEIFEVEPTCSTSNCSWDSFRSVGWCTKCEDVVDTARLSDCGVSEYLRNISRKFSPYPHTPDNSTIGAYLQETSLKLPSCKVDLGNGDTYSLLSIPLYTKDLVTMDLDLEVEAIWPISMGNKLPQEGTLRGYSSFNELNWAPSQSWSTLYRTNTSYMGVPNPLAVFGHVALDFGSEDDLTLPLNISIKHASRCLITLCERQYDVRVEEGTTQTKTLSTNYGSLFAWDATDDIWRGPVTCWQAEPGIVSLSLDGEFSLVDMDRRAFCSVDHYGSHMIRSLQAHSTSPLRLIRYGLSNEYTLIEYLALPRTDSDNVGLLATKDFRSKTEGIAASLTHYGLRRSNATVVGRALTNERYVHVRWVWITLPASLEVVTLILFLATIVQSHRAGLPTWKSSVLAVYYHDEGSKDAGGPLERLSDMDKAAGATTVRLVMDPRVGHVLTRDSTDHQQSAA